MDNNRFDDEEFVQYCEREFSILGDERRLIRGRPAEYIKSHLKRAIRVNSMILRNSSNLSDDQIARIS